MLVDSQHGGCCTRSLDASGHESRAGDGDGFANGGDDGEAPHKVEQAHCASLFL